MGIQTLKKPDGQDQAFSSSREHNNSRRVSMHKILTDIELQRKIYLFQKAVEEHTEKRSLSTAQSVAVAKAELWAFIQGANA